VITLEREPSKKKQRTKDPVPFVIAYANGQISKVNYKR
jgi:hypothetical protein